MILEVVLRLTHLPTTPLELFLMYLTVTVITIKTVVKLSLPLDLRRQKKMYRVTLGSICDTSKFESALTFSTTQSLFWHSASATDQEGRGPLYQKWPNSYIHLFLKFVLMLDFRSILSNASIIAFTAFFMVALSTGISFQVVA